ncbi:MAG TPA: ATP-binding protein [Acidothermaceae bacterium]|nr:ATP-binding protein [Acidothermaceae bacterium]
MARLSLTRGPLASLRWRLLAAFLAVSFGAVAIVAGIAAASVRDNTARLLDRQRDQLREQIANALSAAFAAGQGSAETNTLAGLQALAEAQGGQLDVVDSTGRHLTEQHHGSSSPTPTTLPTPTHDGSDHGTPSQQPNTPRQTPSPTPEHRSTPQPTATGGERHGQTAPPNRIGRDSGVVVATVAPAPAILLVAATPPAPASPSVERVTIPVVVDGSQVATAYLNLPTSDAAVAAARRGLLDAVMWAAVLAAGLATVVAIVVSRRVSKPLLRLASATRAFAAGDPHPEATLRPAPGELGEVGRTFAAMAATLRRQEELRRSLIADVAHELRTPVTILRGQTEQFLDGIEAPTTARIVSLHDEVLRLERLTDDLATLSAADAAGLSLRRKPTNLSSLVRQTFDAMLPTLAAAELEVENEIEDDVTLDADADRVKQVITNLLVNAAKFTPPAGRIDVALHRDPTHAILTVSDSGPGIPDDELPHVFERFWRGRTKGHTSGSGVGLSVVQSIVNAHDGTVTADNNANGGARFTVRLPAPAAPASRPESRHPQAAAS